MLDERETAISLSLVDELVRTQFPRWRDLPLTQLEHGGTSNEIFRLGDELALRLPRRGWARHQAERDFATVPLLAPHLPFAVPEPLALGEPTEDYPYHWSVVRWLDGEPAKIGQVDQDTPHRLVELIHALHSVDATGVEWTTYRGRLDQAGQDDAVRGNIAVLGDDPTLIALWEQALDAPRWARPGRWLHADLHEGNLLFTGGRLSGVIDWGSAGVGDPAGDLMTAWLFLDERGRRSFRRELGEFDDATWARARGWALQMAVVALPYYRDTNPFLADVARHILGQLVPERSW